MKLQDVVSLNSNYNSIKEKKLPIVTLYKITKLFDILDRESEFYTESLKSIIVEYAERDSEGKPIVLPSKDGYQLRKDKIEEAQQKMTQLMDIDVAIPEDLTFELSEIEPLDLTVEEFRLFLPLIKK